MATPIKMPDLGTTVEAVTLVAWLKQEGEPVKRGEPLCEVETDKATDQLESVAAGVLLRQAVPAMTEVRTGTVIAYIGSPGEAIPDESAAARQERCNAANRSERRCGAEDAAGDPQSGQARGRRPRCGRRQRARRPNHPRGRAASEAGDRPRRHLAFRIRRNSFPLPGGSRRATARFPRSI